MPDFAILHICRHRKLTLALDATVLPSEWEVAARADWLRRRLEVRSTTVAGRAVLPGPPRPGARGLSSPGSSVLVGTCLALLLLVRCACCAISCALLLSSLSDDEANRRGFDAVALSRGGALIQCAGRTRSALFKSALEVRK